MANCPKITSFPLPIWRTGFIFQSQVKPSQERERTVKYDLLYNAQVIAGTLNGIGSSVLKQFFESRKENWRQGFDCIIIDEVGATLLGLS